MPLSRHEHLLQHHRHHHRTARRLRAPRRNQTNTMKTKLPVLITIVLVTNVLPLHAAPENPAPPPEMKELNRLAGSWKVVEIVGKKAEWTPEEVRTKGGSTTMTKWIFDGHFLEDRKTHSTDGNMHLGIWSYDAQEKAYHYTMFQTAHGRTDFTIRWDEKKEALIGTAPMPGGVTMRTTMRFPDADTKDWHAVATDAAGKVYLDMHAVEKRQPEK